MTQETESSPAPRFKKLFTIEKSDWKATARLPDLFDVEVDVETDGKNSKVLEIRAVKKDGSGKRLVGLPDDYIFRRSMFKLSAQKLCRDATEEAELLYNQESS